MRISLKLLLALSTTSLITVARAQDIIPPKQYTMTPGGVNLSDGSFTLAETDIAVGGLTLTRFHIGGQRDPNTTPFGPRMSHNFDIYVAPNRRTDCQPGFCTTYKKPIVHLGQSASGTYYESLPPNVIIQNQNDDARSGNLEYNSAGAYIYTDQSGNIYTFSTTITAAGANDSRRVTNIVFADGRQQDFIYNGAGQLKAVMENSGYAIVFDYNASGNIAIACGYNLSATYVSVSSTCTGAALKVSYGYTADSTPKLATVTDPRNGITSYSYDRNEITCITPPGYSSCKISNVYGSSQYAWQVTQQTLAGGLVWKFQYWGNYLKARDPEIYVEIEPATGVAVTDPANKTSSYTFVQSSPYGMVDANGKSTSYTFSGGADYFTQPGWSTRFGSYLSEVVLPEGNKYQAGLGPRRVAGQQRMVAKPVNGAPGLPDIVNDVGFYGGCDGPNTRQNCTKPLWRRDAKGNQTDYSYTANGLLLTEIQPAPSAGAARPLKLFAYVQKYAYIKNSSGSLVPAASPIWLPATETQCQTIAGSSVASCDSGAPITVTTYEYGANGTADNLLVRGKVVSSGGVSLRTCYGYDWMGNKIWETAPRAGLAVCS